MKTIFNPDAPEEQAKTRQDILHSAYRAMEARDQGTTNTPILLKECLTKRIWEKPRVLSSGNTVEATSFREFVYGHYPMGLDSSYEKIERLLAGKPSLAEIWKELTGRTLPQRPPHTVQHAVADVVVGDSRKRQLDETRVQSLAESILEIGLLNPISVTETGKLVAGRHRLEACKRLGWELIPAQLIELDDLHRELAEIDENLIRFELTVLERSEHLKRRKEIYEAIHPETRHGGTGRGRPKNRVADSATLSASSFVDDTAKKTGRGARTVREEVQIAESLDDETKEAVRGTSIENRKTDLLGLAREKDLAKRREIVDRVKSGKAKSATGSAKPPQVRSDAVERVVKLVERMQAKDRLELRQALEPLFLDAEHELRKRN
jgi:hypothetical protein